MKNAVGRELPERVGSYEIHPYEGLGREQSGPAGRSSGRTAGSRSFKRIWFPQSVPRGSGTA